MKKGFKKLVAVALSAGLFASSFAGGVTVQAEDAKEVKKGTVITDFKEVKDVNELEPGIQYFFSTKQYGVEDAVAALPAGSAVLQFAGTDVEEAIEAGTFEINHDYYESFESYVQFQYEQLAMNYPLTEEAVFGLFSGELGQEITSWEDLVEANPSIGSAYPTIDAMMADIRSGYEECLAELQEDFSGGESGFLEENECATWDEFVEEEWHKYNDQIDGLVRSFENSYVQKDQDGYVSIIQRGSGFDSCDFGTIAYLENSTEEIKQQISNGGWESSVDGPGWYYGCCGSLVGYVGPFYLYSYNIAEFTEDDLIITFAKDWKEPTTAAKVRKKDITLSIIVDGEEICIPFYDITDPSVDPTNDDTTITLKVGQIEKVIEVCNVEAGEIEKDVQISEGAPTVGLEDAVDALKETVLTEAELKLVASGVDVDIYMTVVSKKAEELGEDKAILEKAMSKDDKAVYLDLKLFKKIGNSDPTAITEVPGGKIKVSVVVPDSIKKFADKAKVVRVHGTEVTELKTTYDAATNKLSFETDRFSTYAIVYSDVASGSGATPTPTPTPAPNSGDTAMVGLYMALVVVGAAVVLKRKNVTSV